MMAVMVNDQPPRAISGQLDIRTCPSCSGPLPDASCLGNATRGLDREQATVVVYQYHNREQPAIIQFKEGMNDDGSLIIKSLVKTHDGWLWYASFG